MRPAALSLAALLAACAAPQRAPGGLDLADRSADCSCAYSMFILTTRETGDGARIRDAEQLVPSVEYFVAAGQALSTKEHVERRRTATLASYLERRARISSDYPEEVRRRRFLDALAVDLAECTLLQKQRRRELDDAARSQLDGQRERTP